MTCTNKIAILGGSFNPVHQGHLFLADAVLSRLLYDRVIFVPAYRSPFKLAAAGMESSSRDRLQMITASITGDPRLTVDSCELKREGVSYTIDTIDDIIRRYAPEGKPGLIIGDDLADDFMQWHKSEEILAKVDIIIARRIHSGNLNVPYPFIGIDNDVINISSAAIRESINSNGVWRYLVPSSARAIIEGKGLYGCNSSETKVFNTLPTVIGKSSAGLIRHVEETVRENLSLERFIHSRSTALFAWDMCRRLKMYNDIQLHPEKAYLAGIAHDFGKELGDKEQIRLAKIDGKGISRLEKDKPSLLHGRVSAILLQERFKIYDSAVLEAVALHTYGGVNMGPLAKIIYIADKLEISRNKYEPSLRNLAYTETNLDKIFYAVFDQNVSSLRKRKLKLAEETLRLLEEMKGL